MLTPSVLFCSRFLRVYQSRFHRSQRRVHQRGQEDDFAGTRHLLAGGEEAAG